MLHATRLLALGRILAVVDDEGGSQDLHCGDKDSAFELIAESADDVFAFVDDPEQTIRDSGVQGADAPRPEPVEEEEPDADGNPLRFYFFCAHEDDRYWLHGACFSHRRGLTLAAIEMCPVSGEGVCHVRVPRGVRVIPIVSAE